MDKDKAKSNDSIEQLRKKIDALDKDLLRIISARGHYAMQVAVAKREQLPDEQEQSFYRSEREADILRRMQTENPGPLSNDEISRLFQEIMSACLALEKPLTIGFLGPEATFTQQAALKYFGHSVNTVGLDSIEEVFRHTEKKLIEYGVVPIENSTEGVVTHTLDQFMTSPLKVVGEIQMLIHHHLLSQEEELEEIQTIYSHPQSFAQCRQWLNTHCGKCEQVAASSTAAAALKASQTKNSAAICSEIALQYYPLKWVRKNIEDTSNNRTRFLVIGRHTAHPSSKDKTSLLLSTNNQSGALAKLLQPFSNHGVSLTRIESRPAKTSAWDYIFFVDAEGHAEKEPLRQIINELKKQATLVNLGSYPCSSLGDE